MARDPKKGDSPSKRKRGQPKVASGRRGASKRPQKRLHKGPARPARATKSNRSGASGIAALKRQLKEALARQTATAEVLQVISSSPGDLKPVFDRMLAEAMRLCEAQCGFIYQIEHGAMRAVAEIGVPPAFAEYRRRHLHTGGAATPADIMRATKRPAHVHDARDSDAYRQGNPNAVAGVELGGARTVLYVPMIRNDDIVGVINLYRLEVKPFTDQQIALLENFASQAVIATENARLFNETREALARQTATAEILKVIASSPDDVQPVFDAIAVNARRVIGGHSSLVTRVVGDQLHLAAFTAGSEAGREKLTSTYPQPISSPVMSARVVRTGQVCFYADTERDADDITREFARARGYRSVLAVPMLRERSVIGTINVTRVEPGEFDENTIALLKTFADQAVIAIENTRLFNETKEALARQTATADVLKVIASSPSNLQPVFDAIAERSKELVAGHSTTVFRFAGDVVELVGATSVGAEADAVLRATFPMPVSRMRNIEKVLRGEISEIVDVMADTQPDDSSKDVARARGWRSRLVVPLKGDNAVIGFISLTRKEPGAFADKDKELVRTFADQAVIAIQNVELFEEVQAKTRDLEESLQQQTATSDVLKMIASSPGDLTPMFDVMLECATRLCEASYCHVWRFDGQLLHAVAVRGDPWFAEWLRKNSPVAPIAGSAADRIARGEDIVHIVDRREEQAYSGSPVFRELVDSSGMRASLSVALRRDGALLGMINVYRQEARPFSDKQIALLQNFADQAVIAMENARLFNETREALARQTATADVLKVIASSPSNLQPVFDAIAERSKSLIGGHSTTVTRFVGEMAELVSFTPVSPEADATLQAMFPRRIDSDPQAESVLRGEIVQIADAESEILPPYVRNLARARGFRSRLFVPLKGDNEVIGLISVTRKEPGVFADKDVELLRTFADQAVIAIQNVKLFDEVQARTADLQESLQQQTATADVLKVISRSAFDLQAVLDTLVESAYKLCGASLGLLYLRGDEAFECKAIAGVGVGAASELFKGRPIRAGRGTAAERVILTGEVHAVTDFFADPEFDPIVRDRIRNDSSGSNISQLRSTLAVPMMRENEVVGVMVIARPQTGAFPQRQIELLQTFADQAVIAIENARLFGQVQARTRELQESLEQQTATAEILSSISGSMNDTKPVFDAIVRSLLRLFGTRFAVVQTLDEGIVEMPAADGEPGFERLRERYPRPLARDTVGGIAMLEKRTLQFHPVLGNPAAPVTTQQFARDFGFDSVLFNPMLSGDKVVGAIGVARHEALPFDDKQIALIASFANQAVIAIENTRLLRELQERTDALTRSLDDLRAAQDRLVQTEKLASLGQLTAGIAHEIKNPLNFVNNFSALSVELTDELNEVLRQAQLAEKTQQDVNELTQLLKSNLEKVVQHGKRADSIVKNMLLHSREGSGEQRAADINALVEESLNLAYHGARAEKFDFNITLEREFDADAGEAELFPQEITRALLNLISNGFYAATRRKTENGEASFEPTLLATTKNLGHSVEIRIRDNGTGIPPEVKEKMFNPFFTTKPAGEGTGLGLSMTHDIIVKQHGGTIDVATEPGSFTEFILVLPRASNAHGKSKGSA